MFGDSKDLLGIKALPLSEIQEILARAKEMKEIIMGQDRKMTTLQGRTINILFYENSTRTRLSFEMGAKMMGSIACNISASGSSVKKGENLIDTARTIDFMQTDILIMRHGMSGAPHLVAKNVNAAVINAGDGAHEHPTQALLDAYTMIEKKGDIKDARVVIVGDVAHSRVARSNILCLNKLGAEVAVCAPMTLTPSGIDQMGVDVYHDVGAALVDADIVMGLRIQLERQKSGAFPSLMEYAREFGVNEARMKKAKPDALIMHPGPVNRDVEITSTLYDCDKSVIDEQVTNGVAVRMALMAKAVEL